ncbi:hypothetical protein FHT76_000468 [Rhizobium sp. BK176]|nr:hypothetical protein [Rhizobium sp. BK176]
METTEMWMNRDDIDRMVETAENYLPEVLPFAKYLADWRDVVDDNSDGWPHWTAGSKCAEKLMKLLREADDSRRGRGSVPPRELFLKALTPIKSFATQRGLPKPELDEDRPAPAANRGPRF